MVNQMKGSVGLGIHWNANRVLVAAAVFLVSFANLAFFRNMAAAFATDPWGGFHLASIALLLLCAQILFLTVLSFRSMLKPTLTLLFLLSAITAYFMDTYNVIIDRDMIVNVMATDSAESWGLLTPALLVYVGLLGLLPSLLLWRVPVRPETVRSALRSRLLLASGAVLTILALVLISSAFYASLVREHKALRYYANPLTPIYSAYKYGKTLTRRIDVQVAAIGEDAHIPAKDIDRELVILVVGETARADRFSLNGYDRVTNPLLGKQDLVSFTNVSACATSTAFSLPCMFAVLDRDEFSLVKSESTENVLDVLDHAGVGILWRDNNSSSKGVADRVLYENFRSPERNPICEEECRDEGMLSGLQEYIDRQTTQDILIVLHQMGSHGPGYYKRYPAKFRKFRPTCNTNQFDSCSRTEIGNTYDNTILYTDYFLSKVIELLRRNDDRFETAMMYVGDHGESLGESGVFLHGMPYWIAPDSQIRVPMILWFGKNYDDADVSAMRRLRGESVSHDNVFHTLLGLFEIETRVYDGSKDLLRQSRDLAAVRPVVG